MRQHFDPRVLSAAPLDSVRECQRRVDCHLGGGTALSGVWLSHRLSRDIDLFCHDGARHRELVGELTDIARGLGGDCKIVRDGRHHVRASLSFAGQNTELDVVFEPAADLEAPPPPIDGVTVESLTDLRASKLTCLLSRAEIMGWDWHLTNADAIPTPRAPMIIGHRLHTPLLFVIAGEGI